MLMYPHERYSHIALAYIYPVSGVCPINILIRTPLHLPLEMLNLVSPALITSEYDEVERVSHCLPDPEDTGTFKNCKHNYQKRKGSNSNSLALQSMDWKYIYQERKGSDGNSLALLFSLNEITGLIRHP